jgi:hypothetical protein
MSRLPSGSDRLVTRRTLLRNAAWAGVGVWTAAKSWDEVRAASPNEKLNIAGIGVGGRGADKING